MAPVQPTPTTEPEPAAVVLAPARSRLARLLEAPAHRLCFASLTIAELGLLGVAAARSPDAITSLGVWISGLAAWTLVEYVLHRGLFHVPRTHPLSVLGARQHLDHHDAPSRLPISKPLHLTLPAIVVASIAAWWIGPLALAACAGLVAGYLGYELMHVGAHVLRGDHPWPAQRHRHLAHHRDDGEWFGITSPIWDRVFGTGAASRDDR